jgi:hypothetical protein
MDSGAYLQISKLQAE